MRSRTPAPIDVDTLAGRWGVALAAARSALRAAGHTLGSQEAAAHSRRLRAERGETVRLLQGLAHDQHAEPLLLRLLAAPEATPHLLGLSTGVAACLFDLDGVLTTSASLHADAWAETLDNFLLDRADRQRREFVPFDRNRDYELFLASKPRLDGIRAFLADRGISLPKGDPADPADSNTVHGLANRKNQLLRQRLAYQGVAAYAGSRSYLQAARMLGLKRAVVSASTSTQTMLQQAGLDQLLGERIDSSTIETDRLAPKPAPDTLLAACERLQVPPEQTADFETTPAGIAAARAAGIHLAIAVDRNGDTTRLRASDADLVVRDLAELLVQTLT